MKKSEKLRLYFTTPHPVYWLPELHRSTKSVEVEQTIRIRHKTDVHKLVAECEAEQLSNAIPVRHLFDRKPSRRERKRAHRK